MSNYYGLGAYICLNSCVKFLSLICKSRKYTGPVKVLLSDKDLQDW